MTFPDFDELYEGAEPSTLTAFSQNKLERRSEDRPDDCLEKALASENVMFYAFSNGDALVRDASVLHELGDIEAFNPDLANASLLGWTSDEQPRISVALKPTETQLEKFQFISLRQIYADMSVSDGTLGELAQAASLLAWVGNNMFCGSCGGPTVPKAGGYSRACPSCEKVVFPRTDPVAIMLIIDPKTDRCLLGRSPHFLPNMYSTLAGFVEQAETIEDAVRRESFEESGLQIGRVRYHASQPWPMPHSLMIGCFAEALTTEISFDENELADCRWFTRKEVAERLKFTEGEERQAPPDGAIANRLMRDWLDYSK